jgi:glycosyltransferase involved in cell wall biosynthesis
VKRKIRILVIPSWYPPDGGFFFKEHSESLAGEGSRVDVLYNRVVGARKLGRIRAGDLFGLRTADENGLFVNRSVFLKIPGNERLNALRWISSTVRLFRRYHRRYGKPDVILAHSAIWAGCAAGILSEKYGIPCLITEHRGIFLMRDSLLRKQLHGFYRPLLHDAFGRADRIILVSDGMKRGIFEIDPGLEKKVKVIPNMVNGDFFSFPEKEREPDPFVFIWAGRLVPLKRVDLLIDAFTGLSAGSDRPVKLRVLGKGPEKERLEERAAELGMPVEFTGRLRREDLRTAMQEAHCFVLASEYESFGAVLIEAMATGLPVIATRCGGPESIVDAGSGYLIEPGNKDALLDAMQRMIKGYSGFNQQKIRESCLARFGSRELSVQYLDIFRELIRRTSAG